MEYAQNTSYLNGGKNLNVGHGYRYALGNVLGTDGWHIV